jgi:hypothetical protein
MSLKKWQQLAGPKVSIRTHAFVELPWLYALQLGLGQPQLGGRHEPGRLLQ